MQRFIARRGQPEEVRSDNGRNFVRGEKELREVIKGWNQHMIGEFLLQQNVKWTFNPPGGSHHGGVWERCIRTVRNGHPHKRVDPQRQSLGNLAV